MALLHYSLDLLPELSQPLLGPFTRPPVDPPRLIDQLTYNFPHELELHLLLGVNLLYKCLVIQLQLYEILWFTLETLLSCHEVHALLLVQLVETMDQSLVSVDGDELQ